MQIREAKTFTNTSPNGDNKTVTDITVRLIGIAGIPETLTMLQELFEGNAMDPDMADDLEDETMPEPEEEEEPEPQKPRRRRKKTEPPPESEEDDEEEPEKKPTRRRRKKAEPEEEPEKKPTRRRRKKAEPEEEEEPEKKPTRRRRKKATPSGPTKQDVAKAAALAAEELGTKLAGDIIGDYSETGNIEDIPEDQWQAFIDDIAIEVED